jgi:hypothetical protein
MANRANNRVKLASLRQDIAFFLLIFIYGSVAQIF